MCFSAATSFTAGTLLSVLGAVSLRHAQTRFEIPFAAIPLLFGMQQISEGVVWVAQGKELSDINFYATQFFSFFSHVLWPVWIPVATLAIEPSIIRRRLLYVSLLIGAAVSMFLLFSMLTYPVKASPSNGHIEYFEPHLFQLASVIGYLSASTLSLLISSHQCVQYFGVLTAISLVVSYWLYMQWFTSVWCFFAALMSFSVVICMSRLKR